MFDNQATKAPYQSHTFGVKSLQHSIPTFIFPFDLSNDQLGITLD